MKSFKFCKESYKKHQKQWTKVFFKNKVYTRSLHFN